MRHTKKLITMLLAVCMVVCALPVSVFADSKKLSYSAKTSGNGNTIKLKKVTYDYEQDDHDDRSEIEVDFKTKVKWKAKAKVTSVKDNKGKSYKGYLTDKDNDECEISIKNLKEGRTYTIVINGIKKAGTSSYRKLTLKVKIPAAKENKTITVKKVIVDDDDDINVKFSSKVTWKKSAKIASIKDNTGKTYKGYLTDKDDDECEISIKNMKADRTYTIKISGIKAKGASDYTSLTVKAVVPPDDDYYDDDDDDDDDDYYDDDYDDDDD